MNFKMVHNNINVANLDESMKFYDKALGLKEVRRVDGDGFTIVMLGDGLSHHLLELTVLTGHPEKYNLGENEFHLAIETEEYEEAFKYHKENGWVCYENIEMGLYFIVDPDGYWIEILPKK